MNIVGRNMHPRPAATGRLVSTHTVETTPPVRGVSMDLRLVAFVAFAFGVIVVDS